MTWLVQNLWLVPALPLLAAGASAVLKKRCRTLAASLAIGSMVLALVLACAAFAATLRGRGEVFREARNFDWFALGDTPVRLGWVLDPLAACMLVMVTFVGTLIFIYSVGYMARDENFTRFFCFLSLFAAAMLGLVIANSLLLLFISWELVGLSSYLLIGFWYQKPSAAAAAKKAFITTRIGDLGLFLGMLWLYAESGTLLFYDGGNGCLESSSLARLVGQTTIGGMMVSTAVSLLIFCGAMGKSGQVPLHVWLPDAMEGPTPVSALIHAATMVAAGVFLVARVFPLMTAHAGGMAAGLHPPHTTALLAVTWVGAITAVFAALIAVAQTDLKRILAYSTVSQLGYMMMGLGVGGVAVGMFHLITHAFFKALLFLGAGSVIHGCHDEQDIRYLGGLRKSMPVTFATYAVGMMALSGVPLLFSGFWSKDEILHRALMWEPSRWPFYLGALGAFLTAFYMTRQMWFVFFGKSSAGLTSASEVSTAPANAGGEGTATIGEGLATPEDRSHSGSTGHLPYVAHESPPVMTVPLIVLAVCAILLGIIGTPWWPWFHDYLGGHPAPGELAAGTKSGLVLVMLLSVIIVTAGIGLAWWLYSRSPARKPEEPDPLEEFQPGMFNLLRGKFFVDELYALSVVRFNAWCARACQWLDDKVWGGLVVAVSFLVLALSWLNRLVDEFVVNLGFDKGCGSLHLSGRLLSFWQNGQVQRYLRVIALALTAFTLILLWGCE